MAARLNPQQMQRTREAIQATKLVQRLQAFALGAKEDGCDKGIVMTPAQVSAALGLLKKAVPDLQVTALTGENGGPVQVQSIERVIVRPAD